MDDAMAEPRIPWISKLSRAGNRDINPTDWHDPGCLRRREIDPVAQRH
jgi:hypothetical protein